MFEILLYKDEVPEKYLSQKMAVLLFSLDRVITHPTQAVQVVDMFANNIVVNVVRARWYGGDICVSELLIISR